MSMLHEITAGVPRHKRTQRKGRGESSGRGKTSGKGNKGAKARVGKYVKRGHEHGQTPIYRRLPKRGFSNSDFERRFHIVNLADLQSFADGTIVDSAALVEAGLVPDLNQPVKILGDGTMTRKLTVVVGWYSRSALEKITQAGGTAQNVKGEVFAFPKPKKKFIKREAPKKSKQSEAPAEAEAAPAGGAEKPAAEASKPAEDKSTPAE
jgi:large subunit ribosomal protein L15